MKTFFKKLLSEDGSISSKRFIALVGFFALLVTMFVNSFTDVSKVPADNLVSAVEFITISAIGGVASEKFFRRYTENKLDQKFGNNSSEEEICEEEAIETDSKPSRKGRPRKNN